MKKKVKTVEEELMEKGSLDIKDKKLLKKVELVHKEKDLENKKKELEDLEHAKELALKELELQKLENQNFENIQKLIIESTKDNVNVRLNPDYDYEKSSGYNKLMVEKQELMMKRGLIKNDEEVRKIMKSLEKIDMMITDKKSSILMVKQELEEQKRSKE